MENLREHYFQAFFSKFQDFSQDFILPLLVFLFLPLGFNYKRKEYFQFYGSFR